MPTTTTYFSLQDIGIPIGTISGSLDSIFMAQDEFTREYHTISPNDFIKLCDDSWRKDEVMSISYSGNVAVIDLPTQTVAHIYDPTMTSENELRNFEVLVATELLRLMEERKRKRK